jgi:hypothetical protein
MKTNDNHDPYLPPRKSDKDRFIVEVPLEAKMPKPDRLPSGYDPIQSIGLEGRAFRSLAGGRIPWWVANSNLKCNTCSKLVCKGESVNQASMVFL